MSPGTSRRARRARTDHWRPQIRRRAGARARSAARASRRPKGCSAIGEIAERTGLPKPTVSRLTYTLTKLGYLAHVERLGKYQLAPAALALGYSALANMRIRQIARPYMQELADYAGAVGRARHARPARPHLCRALPLASTARCCASMLGSRLPIATTAMGRALIAGMPDERARLADRLHQARRKARTGRRSGPASSARSRISRRAASRSRSANGSATSTRSACR